MILKSRQNRNMAKSYSLEELQKRYSTLKGLVTKSSKQKEASIAAYEDAEKKLGASNGVVDNLKNRLAAIEAELGTYEQGSSDYAACDKKYKKAADDLKKAEQEQQKNQEAFDKAKSSLETVRLQYSSYDEELQVIKISFARDPRINKVLQESLEVEYDKRIKQQSNLVNETTRQSVNLTKALKDDTTLADLVAKLKEAFAEKSKYSPYSTDSAAVDANKSYANAATALRNAVKGMNDFKTVELTDADLEAVITDQPVLAGEIKKQEQIKTDLEAKKIRVLQSIESAKVPPAGSKEELEKQKADKEAEISSIDARLAIIGGFITSAEADVQKFGIDPMTADLDVVIAQLENDIQNANVPDALTQDEEDELQELINRERSGVDTTRVDAAKDAEEDARIDRDDAKSARDAIQQDNDVAKEELTDSDYITPEALKALELDNDDTKNLYNEFFELDRELRKKFLAIKGTEVEDKTDNEDLKNLDEAIKKYQDKAQELSDATGFSIGAWQDYLLRDVSKRIENGKEGFEEIPEEYATGLAEARFEKFAKDAGIEEGNPNYDSLKESLEKLSEQEKAVLEGKDPATYKQELNGYIDNTNSLDDDTRAAFFSSMKSSLTKAAKGLWSKIKGLFSKATSAIKNKFEPEVKEEPDDYSDLIKNVKDTGDSLTLAESRLSDAEARLSDAQTELSDAEEELRNAGGLNSDDQRRKQELMDKRDARTSGTTARTELEARKQKVEGLKNARENRKSLEEQRAIFEQDRDTLQTQIDNTPAVEDIVITDSGAIHDSKGTLYKDVRSSYDEER